MSSQSSSFIWNQVDHNLAGLMLREVLEEFQHLVREDVLHIQYQNIGSSNDMTILSDRMEMHRLRAEELVARHYAVYCEVWRCQQKTLSPDFLREICRNSLRSVIAIRVSGVRSEFASEQMRTRTNEQSLKPAMEEFKRSMGRLYAKWERAAEIDAKSLEHMSAASPNNPDAERAATQVVHARIQLRIIEARLASLKARIISCERALNARKCENSTSIESKVSNRNWKILELRNSSLNSGEMIGSRV